MVFNKHAPRAIFLMVASGLLSNTFAQQSHAVTDSRLVSHYDCTSDPALLKLPLGEIFERFDNIFVGLVADISAKPGHETTKNENECWVRLQVTEAFKEETPRKEYHALFYTEPLPLSAGQSLLKPYCSVKRNEKYLVFTDKYHAEPDKGQTSLLLIPGCSFYMPVNDGSFMVSLLRRWQQKPDTE